jgi:SPP1 gp7 family putative phage head morphogenesis protein
VLLNNTIGRTRLYYATRCPVCGGTRHAPDLADSGFTDIINAIAAQLYNKKLETGIIPRALYESTAEQLMKAVFDGLGGSTFGYTDPNNKLITYLRQNIYSFSAAKSLTEMKAFNELLVDASGKLRSKADFIGRVAQTGALFNKTYLGTEYDTAVASAQMAQKWNEFPDDAILQYSTVHDDKVRPWHAILDGKTAPKSDPIWLKIYPPLDWNCRCTVIPGESNKVAPHNRAELIKEARIPKQFQNNSGITRTIYKNDHLYYQVSGKTKELSAEVNYGMPSVKKLYATNDFPVAQKRADIDEANNWWREKAGKLRASFDVRDKLGNSIRFSNETRAHILHDNNEGRFSLISNVEDIVSKPDEVWSVRDKGSLITTYIKYYEDFPYAVQVYDDQAFTAFSYSHYGKLNQSSIDSDRRGTLLYRKN